MVKAVMSPIIPNEKELLLEPNQELLEKYGVVANKSIVVGKDGYVCRILMGSLLV